MNLFAIADIHLSFGVDNKDMNIFKGWSNHAERLRENWNGLVGEDDTVVIAGDVSWGKTLEQSLPDFEFIDSQLNGTKIILKGNHDYWWCSLTKMQGFLAQNGINSIRFLHNNAYKVGDFVVCGTRGWLEDEDIMQREARRLEASIIAGLNLTAQDPAAGGCAATGTIVFLHYPPIYAGLQNEYILEVLNRLSIRRVFSGHIHSSGIGGALIGERFGIRFDMISADYLKFIPKKIL